MAQPSKRVKVIAAVVSPLLFLLLLELVLRIAGYRYEPAAGDWVKIREQVQTEIYEPDPLLIWRLMPGTVIDLPGYGFRQARTNRFGLRGQELPGPRGENELRVLCLGDSVTFGLGVGDEDTYPVRLRNDLSARPELQGRPVTVVNGAVPGWSSVQGMRLLDRFEWLEPDVVVFWFGMNDVQEIRGIPDSRHRGAPGAATKTVTALGALRTVQLLQGIVAALRPEENQKTRVSREEYAEAVAELTRRQAEGGPKVIFIRYPSCSDETEAQLARVVARAEEEGVSMVAGPGVLLGEIIPAPEDFDLEGQVATGPAGREIVFCGQTEMRVSLDEVRKALGRVRSWNRELDARLQTLPDDAVTEEEMFGDAATYDVFQDNVHLSAEGNRRAAEAIAARIVRLLAE